jgi:hypothetical protein
VTVKLLREMIWIVEEEYIASWLESGRKRSWDMVTLPLCILTKISASVSTTGGSEERPLAMLGTSTDIMMTLLPESEKHRYRPSSLHDMCSMLRKFLAV